MARLFFALLPDAFVRDQIERFAHSCEWDNAMVVKPSQFHITLSFVGDVDANVLPLLLTIPLLTTDFQLELVRARVWDNGIAVLEAQSSKLDALHRSINLALHHIGISAQSGSYRPHVTLARHAQAAILPDLRPIAWSVRSFSLMETPQSNPDTYQIRQTFPLV